MPLSEKLNQAGAGKPVWARPLPARLRAMGRTLSPAEVLEAIAKLDDLSSQRDEIAADPDLNCDDADDVHFAQHDLAIALRQCSVRAASALTSGLKSPNNGTRFWTAWSLQSAGTRSCMAAIQQALLIEQDALIRKALNTALANIKAMSWGPLGLIGRRLRALTASDA